MSERTEALEAVVHKVSSKAASLKGAAGLLLKATPVEREELLGLMTQHAEGLARYLAELRKNGGAP